MLKNGAYAYGLGFNPNILAISIFVILIVRLYLMEQKPKIWWEGISVAIIINMVTNCRSVVAFLILLSIILFFDVVQIVDVKILACISEILPIVLSFISIFIARNFDMSNIKWLELNHIMSARPYLYHLYYTNFPIRLLGNYFDKTNYGALDNTYLMFLFRYGVVIYVIYMFIFFKAIVTAKKKQDHKFIYYDYIFCIFLRRIFTEYYEFGFYFDIFLAGILE